MFQPRFARKCALKLAMGSKSRLLAFKQSTFARLPSLSISCQGRGSNLIGLPSPRPTRVKYRTVRAVFDVTTVACFSARSASSNHMSRRSLDARTRGRAVWGTFAGSRERKLRGNTRTGAWLASLSLAYRFATQMTSSLSSGRAQLPGPDERIFDAR